MYLGTHSLFPTSKLRTMILVLRKWPVTTHIVRLALQEMELWANREYQVNGDVKRNQVQGRSNWGSWGVSHSQIFRAWKESGKIRSLHRQSQVVFESLKATPPNQRVLATTLIKWYNGSCVLDFSACMSCGHVMHMGL